MLKIKQKIPLYLPPEIWKRIFELRKFSNYNFLLKTKVHVPKQVCFIPKWYWKLSSVERLQLCFYMKNLFPGTVVKHINGMYNIETQEAIVDAITVMKYYLETGKKFINQYKYAYYVYKIQDIMFLYKNYN